MTGGLPLPLPTVPAGRPAPEEPARPVSPQGDAANSAALRVRCHAEGFALARAFTRDTLRRWSLEHRSDDASLVITELAANAVAHAMPRSAVAEAQVWLGIRLAPAHVLLSVSDPGDAAPEFTLTDCSGLQESGRGLFIVDTLADEWGWTLRPPVGKTVWARLSTCSPP